MISFVQSLDMRVLLDLAASRTDTLTRAMIVVSTLGEWTVILLLSFAIAMSLYFKRLRTEASGLLVATAGGALAVLILKYLVLRPRPDVALRAIVETSPSFPSAHAALAVAFFGFLAYLIVRDNKRLRIVPIAAVVVLCAIIGFSRLYLGVHYLSDVIGGYAVGALFLWIGIEIQDWFTPRATS